MTEISGNFVINVSRQLNFILSSFLLSKFRKILYFIFSRLASRLNSLNPANWLAPRAAASNFFSPPNCLLIKLSPRRVELLWQLNLQVCLLFVNEWRLYVILNAHITYSSLRCKVRGRETFLYLLNIQLLSSPVYFFTTS